MEFIKKNKQPEVIWGTPLLAAVLANGNTQELVEFSKVIAERVGTGDEGLELHFAFKKDGKDLVRISSGPKLENYRINYSLIPSGVLKKDDPGNLFMKSFTVLQLQKMMGLNKNLLRNKIVIIGNSS